ncbi:hypothetical protein QWA_01925 [Alcaligenes faecalis subsp. faecalis NCIB 8687]|nr:hypothetical protein QWA_01925 [Alcaligenes faecalis subsp. faecalis NCIB 8687]
MLRQFARERGANKNDKDRSDSKEFFRIQEQALEPVCRQNKAQPRCYGFLTLNHFIEYGFYLFFVQKICSRVCAKKSGVTLPDDEPGVISKGPDNKESMKLSILV